MCSPFSAYGAPEDFNGFSDIVFGLFANEDVKAADGKTVIAKGSLASLIYVDNSGKGIVSGELPFAKYYVQELKTSNFYQMNDTKYPINVEYKGQDIAVSSVKINNGGVIPNELKLVHQSVNTCTD